MKEQALDKIRSREARVGVVGLGYVGLPLAMVFAEAGFAVTGIDVNAARVAALQRGESPIEDVPSALLGQMRVAGRFEATTDFDAVRALDVVIICVPTPLRKTRDPDVSHIVEATGQVAARLRPGHLVVVESTTYPGTTREVVLPHLEAQGLTVGDDVFLAYSPERVDPGRTDWTTANTPKVVGGTTPVCLEVASTLYDAAVETVVPVSSTEAAEMVKIFENTFRAVNIGLANELLLMCDKLGLDAWEVVEAAATKPFGFMPFTPGPGLGGHCIPVDPHYLSWKLRGLNYTARFIELASEVNTAMPAYWVRRMQDALNEAGKAVNGSTVLVLGVAYKPNVSDLRESPALDIVLLLREMGARVLYHDPFIPAFQYGEVEMAAAPDLDAALEDADGVLLVTNHDAYASLDLAARPCFVNTRGPRADTLTAVVAESAG